MVGLIPIGQLEAASDLTTAESIGTDGSHSQKAVDERVRPVAAEIIADSPTVVAAAENAVASAGDLVFFRQGGATNYLGNSDFAVQPIATATPTPGNWYNVQTNREWVAVTDRPDGAGHIIRFNAGAGFVSQQVNDIASRGLDRKMTLTVTARAIKSGTVDFCRLRLLITTPAGTLMDLRPEDIFGLNWVTRSYEIPVPAGAASVTVGLSVSTLGGHGAGLVEYATATLALAGADLKKTIDDRVVDQVAAGAGDTRYLRLGQQATPIQSQSISFAKGGVVGTNGRAPIALRFDDWQDNIKALGLHQELRNRGLPWSIVLCSRLGSNPWNDEVTYADIRDWTRNYGAEVWSHGTDHKSPWSPDRATFSANLHREIVQSKAEIEAEKIRVMGFALPGVTAPGFGFETANGLDDFALYNSEAGRLLINTYGLVETDVTGYYRNLPSDLRYGLSHATFSDGVPYQTIIDLIDGAIATGQGLELMCHAGNLGTGTNMTVAQALTLFDYLVAKRDEGLIEIVAPSSLPFCDPSVSRRRDLISNGDFTKPVPLGNFSVWGYWWAVNGTSAAVVDVADGPTGAAKVLRTTSAGNPYQAHQQPHRNGISGQTFMLDAWVRGVGGTPSWRLRVNNIAQNHVDALDLTGPTTAGWTRVRRCFTVPATFGVADTLGLFFSGSGTGAVEWSNVHVYVA